MITTVLAIVLKKLNIPSTMKTVINALFGKGCINSVRRIFLFLLLYLKYIHNDNAEIFSYGIVGRYFNFTSPCSWITSILVSPA